MFTRGQVPGITAALLFGIAAPISKLLLPGAGPLGIAGLLYIGAALAMVSRRREAGVTRADAPALAGIVVAGGIAGPALLLYGLSRLPALDASLLLNLEAPFTIALAILATREHLSRREAAGGALIILGAAALATRGAAGGHFSLSGSLLVAGACACWAVDNVLTGTISLKDPAQIVRIKALPAGVVNLALARIVGEPWPDARVLLGALALGAVSYGLSLVLNVRAQRELGAARQAMLFATAPFAGAVAAIPLLGERPGLVATAAALSMAAGVIVMLRARHQHLHTHEALEHEHLHVHDEHHDHAHGAQVEEPHSHVHRHGPVTHEHAHASDVHHRHRH